MRRVSRDRSRLARLFVHARSARGSRALRGAVRQEPEVEGIALDVVARRQALEGLDNPVDAVEAAGRRHTREPLVERRMPRGLGNIKHPESPPQAATDRHGGLPDYAQAPLRARGTPRHTAKTTVPGCRARPGHTSGSGERGLRRSEPPSGVLAGALGLG